MEEEKQINLRQESFCQLYVSKEFFANGTEAYATAYGIDLTKQGQYNVACVNASKLLINPNILARINELIDMSGLNDVYVEKQLLFVITQNADLGAKIGGIREYNKLRGRIDNKLKLDLGDGIQEVSINIKKS